VRGLLLMLAGCGRLGFDASPDTLLPTCTGHDEDGDGFPDPCDVCPTVADGNQRDGDRDGVGDACDPRPALDGDYILRFEPHDDPAAARYTVLVPTFEWRPDVLRIGDAVSFGAAQYSLPANPSRLAIGVQIVDASTTQQMWFGAWYNQESTFQGTEPKIFISAANRPPTTGATFALKEQTTTTLSHFCNNNDPPQGPDFVTGDRYTMVADTSLVTGGDHHVDVTSAAQTWSCDLVVTLPPFSDGFLETHLSVIDFEYFIAYGIR
jgi:hypothetical protein